MQALRRRRGKDARHRGVQLADRKLMHPGIDAVRLHAGNCCQQRRIEQRVCGIRAR